ncbi:hypothetical protein Taro_024354 [Colocasia esculenta]|uniref:Uncharacterized protein n=1 Tax=Colocasia esculenta TaxID=4460 RepID=A0A843V6K2_COLES|nr:hypothetical protein [Colocasia esculenta]
MIISCINGLHFIFSGSHKFVTVVSTQSTCVSTLVHCPRSLKQSEQLKPVVST